MGFAAHKAWTTGLNSLNRRTIELTKQGATLYTVQLGLNLLFMPLFFHWKRPVAATLDIVVLTGVAGYMTYIWSQVDEVAGYFLAPYVSWLGFASYITAGAGYLNNWSFADKERPVSSKDAETRYVDERPE
ncbi:MAG: hypothetical protein Q9162_006178 [Coniocarpon cinnabarinum]